MADEVISTPLEVPSDEYKKTLAEIHAFAKEARDRAERREKADKIAADLEAARAKNRVVLTTPGELPPPENITELMGRNPETMSDLHRELHQTAREVMFAHGVLSAFAARPGSTARYGGPETLKRMKKLDKLGKYAFAGSWDTIEDGAGGGSLGSQDWIGMQYATSVIPVKDVIPRVAGVFPVVLKAKGSSATRLPSITADEDATIEGEATAYTDLTGAAPNISSPPSSFIEIDPRIKHSKGWLMSTEMTEDAVIDMLPYAQQYVTLILRKSIDRAVLNGQSVDEAAMDGTNGWTCANAYRGASVGTSNNSLRRYSHVTLSGSTELDAGGSPLDSSMIFQARKKLGVWGETAEDVVVIPNILAYLDLVNDASDRVVTVDKFGPNATIVTGSVGKIGGMDVIPTSAIKSNLGTDGDAATTGATTSCVLANRTGWVLGMGRDVTVNFVPFLLPKEGVVVIGRVRTAFVPLANTGSDTICATIFNLPTT